MQNSNDDIVRDDDKVVSSPVPSIDSLTESVDIKTITREQSLHKLRVVDLKEILKELELKLSGKKEDLINRILENVEEEWKPPIIEPTITKTSTLGTPLLVSDYTTETLKKLKVSELKQILKDMGLKVSGKKDDLVDRILTGGTNKPPIPDDMRSETPTMTFQDPQSKSKQDVKSRHVKSRHKSIDELLIKSDTETLDEFNLRNIYTRAALSIFKDLNDVSAVLIGRLAANKILLGLTYPEESEKVIDYINLQISLEPGLYVTKPILNIVDVVDITTTNKQPETNQPRPKQPLYTLVLSTESNEGITDVGDNWDAHLDMINVFSALTGYDIPSQHNGSPGLYFSTWEMTLDEIEKYPELQNILLGQEAISKTRKYVGTLSAEAN